MAGALELEWSTSRAVSCFHAAEELCAGRPFVIEELARALDRPARELAGILTAATGDPSRAFTHLVPLSAMLPAAGELANVVLRKSAGQRTADAAGERLTRAIRDYRAVCDEQPALGEDELELRVSPLREQWEARAGGLIRELTELVDDDFFVARADVFAVHPVLGGGGRAHVAYNSVRIEVVLANPHAELPEVLRLVWLVAALNMDVARYTERLAPARATTVSSLALVPLVLAAGEAVELACCDEATIARALDAWCLLSGSGDASRAALAGELATWWETYESGRPPWAIAMEALDTIVR